MLPTSPLRARMIEDMTVRGFNEQTRQHYVRHVRSFAAFIRRSPDTATEEDVRRFQLHQRQSGMQPSSMNSPLRPCTRNSVSPNPDPLALNLATAIALQLARDVLSQ